jgi:osmotically-inducible protein OsmY
MGDHMKTNISDGGTGVLRGSVRSRAETDAAARAAWQAPGVIRVDNELVVSP